MEITKKNEIYERLLAICMKIEPRNLPDPRYIGEKIGLCHVFIEEVETYYIEVNREMSTVQRALNDSIASFENERDNLISTDPIKDLPSLRDREARANTQLKEKLHSIKHYQNELSDLEKLQKAISLKLKNLARLNADIKTQLRVMESQIRLGTPQADNPAARSLAEELSKSTIGKDIFEGMESSSQQETIQDPTKPLDVDALTKPEPSVIEQIFGPSETLSVNDALIPETVTPEKAPENVVPEEPIAENLIDPEIQPDPEQDLDPLTEYQSRIDPDDDIQEFLTFGSKEEIPETASKQAVDLDLILEPVKSPVVVEIPKQDAIIPPSNINTGGDPQPQPKKEIESTSQTTQEKVSSTVGDIDIDSLLSQFKS